MKLHEIKTVSMTQRYTNVPWPVRLIPIIMDDSSGTSGVAGGVCAQGGQRWRAV